MFICYWICSLNISQMFQFYFKEKFDVLRIIRLLVSSRYRRVRKMQLLLVLLYPPQTLFVVGYTVFTLSVRPSVRAPVRPSVTFCFLNNLKSNCWIFIKLCKNIHICKTNTLNKKVRARGQFY